jgi:predicted GNAT family acetyltransferase
MNSPQLAVRDNTEAGEYELFLDGRPVGLAQYQPSEGGLAFVHTEIDPEVAGQGLGGALVSQALDDVRAKGLTVLPYCTFVRHFIETHPEYLDLVPPARRRVFGLDGGE